jgi:hypothetical protein
VLLLVNPGAQAVITGERVENQLSPVKMECPALEQALQLAVDEEAVLLLFFVRQLLVLLFGEEAVQGQVIHVFLVGTAAQVKLAIFVDKTFGHLLPRGRVRGFHLSHINKLSIFNK